MVIAGKKANELHHPVVLDPVGVGASTLRTQTALKLLKRNSVFSYSWKYFRNQNFSFRVGYNRRGVDANLADKVTAKVSMKLSVLLKKFSKKQGQLSLLQGY